MTKLTPAMLDAVAHRFHLLGEPMRLRLLDALRSGERTVGELVEATGGGQANVSKHLQLLLNGGLVDRRKEGTAVYYHLADKSVLKICDLVCGRVEETIEERRRALTGR
jgi:DNA-binding transcriptional ArsR family regulator